MPRKLKQLTEKHIQILKTIQAQQPTSSVKISRVLGIPQNTIYSILTRSLSHHGLIQWDTKDFMVYGGRFPMKHSKKIRGTIRLTKIGEVALKKGKL